MHKKKYKTWMYRVHAIIVTSCHGNNDEAWSTPCLSMQHKPYIVELSFMETQKSHDSINEGPSLTTEGPSLVNQTVFRERERKGEGGKGKYVFSLPPLPLSLTHARSRNTVWFTRLRGTTPDQCGTCTNVTCTCTCTTGQNISLFSTICT